MSKKIAYVIHPFRDDKENNEKNMKFIAAVAVRSGTVPIATALYFPTSVHSVFNSFFIAQLSFSRRLSDLTLASIPHTFPVYVYCASAFHAKSASFGDTFKNAGITTTS